MLCKLCKTVFLHQKLSFERYIISLSGSYHAHNFEEVGSKLVSGCPCLHLLFYVSAEEKIKLWFEIL